MNADMVQLQMLLQRGVGNVDISLTRELLLLTEAAGQRILAINEACHRVVAALQRRMPELQVGAVRGAAEGAGGGGCGGVFLGGGGYAAGVAGAWCVA
jgi:hypothetical protein